MKVIDQINGSAIFAQSAYSASIATKDNLGRDITATYLTAHQSLDDYLTTADANTISSTLSGAITALSGEVPQLSAGEGIDISTVDGKTVITNNISAGSNISLVYDMETNTYRIDSNAGGVSSLVLTASAQPDQYVNWLAGSACWGVQDGIEVTDSATNVGGIIVKTRTSARNADNYFDTDASLGSDGLMLSNSHGRTQRTQYNKASLNINSSAVKYTTAVKSNPEGEPVVTSYSATWEQILNAATGSQGHTYTGVAPIQVNNTTDEISITGESLSAGPGIDMFSSGGYVVVSSTGKELSAGPGLDLFESGGYFVLSSNGAGGSTFPITGTNGTTGFTANMDCSSMMLTTGSSPAGGYVKQTVRGVQYEAYPATDVSASWYNIINATNNRSNCYCIKLNSTNTAASLEDYSAYDRVTVIHAQAYGPDYLLHWDGKTKTFPSGLYCELAKVKDDENEDKWTFLNSGWSFDFWWDYD